VASASGRNVLRSAMDQGPSRPGRRFQLVGEIISELSKVTWPPRQEATRLSQLVVGIALAVGIFLGIWDFGFGQLVNRVLF